MKILIAVFVVILAVFGGGCGVPPAHETANLTEKQFVSELVGATVAWVEPSGIPNKNVRIAINADGTLVGRGRFDESISGKWRWSGDYWCRTIFGDTASPINDCQIVRRDGQDYLFIRNFGNGDAIRYRPVI